MAPSVKRNAVREGIDDSARAKPICAGGRPRRGQRRPREKPCCASSMPHNRGADGGRTRIIMWRRRVAQRRVIYRRRDNKTPHHAYSSFCSGRRRRRRGRRGRRVGRASAWHAYLSVNQRLPVAAMARRAYWREGIGRRGPINQRPARRRHMPAASPAYMQAIMKIIMACRHQNHRRKKCQADAEASAITGNS